MARASTYKRPKVWRVPDDCRLYTDIRLNERGDALLAEWCSYDWAIGELELVSNEELDDTFGSRPFSEKWGSIVGRMFDESVVTRSIMGTGPEIPDAKLVLRFREVGAIFVLVKLNSHEYQSVLRHLSKLRIESKGKNLPDELIALTADQKRYFDEDGMPDEEKQQFRHFVFQDGMQSYLNMVCLLRLRKELRLWLVDKGVDVVKALKNSRELREAEEFCQRGELVRAIVRQLSPDTIRVVYPIQIDAVQQRLLLVCRAAIEVRLSCLTYQNAMLQSISALYGKDRREFRKWETGSLVGELIAQRDSEDKSRTSSEDKLAKATKAANLEAYRIARDLKKERQPISAFEIADEMMNKHFGHLLQQETGKRMPNGQMELTKEWKHKREAIRGTLRGKFETK